MIINKIRYCFEKDWNEKLYWKRRNYIQSHRTGGILSYIRLMLLRRSESKRCSTTGLSLKDRCCYIESPLVLHHGLAGIVIAPNVYIGKNVTIFQNVTISKDNPNKTTVIGDNVMIGAGAVVMNDVPPNATAVRVPAGIIKL